MSIHFLVSKASVGIVITYNVIMTNVIMSAPLSFIAEQTSQ